MLTYVRERRDRGESLRSFPRKDPSGSARRVGYIYPVNEVLSDPRFFKN